MPTSLTLAFQPSMSEHKFPVILHKYVHVQCTCMHEILILELAVYTLQALHNYLSFSLAAIMALKHIYMYMYMYVINSCQVRLNL